MGSGGGGGNSRKKFTRRARNTPSLESAMGSGGGIIAEKSLLGAHVVAEPSKKKSVDSSINLFLVRRLKQVIKIRRQRIFP